jgi:hypothetical protein
LHTPKNIAPSNNDSYLYAFGGDGFYLGGVLHKALGVDAVLLLAHQGLAAELK